jgi:hypothetical protein
MTCRPQLDAPPNQTANTVALAIRSHLKLTPLPRKVPMVCVLIACMDSVTVMVRARGALEITYIPRKHGAKVDWFVFP